MGVREEVSAEGGEVGGEAGWWWEGGKEGGVWRGDGGSGGEDGAVVGWSVWG